MTYYSGEGYNTQGESNGQANTYGIMNYGEMIQKNGYFIDKTRYIEKLERVQNPVFLRPRRFGKSLFCSMLAYYYDICEAHRFDELFGHTWIGQNPRKHITNISF